MSEKLIAILIICLMLAVLALFIVMSADNQTRNDFHNQLTNLGFKIVQGGVTAHAKAYVNHADFIQFANLNNITTLFNQGVYYYAYDTNTQVAYVTSVHWENYVQ